MITITDIQNTSEDFLQINKRMKSLQDNLFIIESEMFFCDQMMKAIQKIDSRKSKIESLREEIC